MKNNAMESEPTRPSRPMLVKDHEQQLSLMIASVKDYAIFMLNPEGRIMSWNTGAEKIKGYTENEIIGKHFSIFYPSEEIQAGKPERELKTALAEGRFEEEGWRLRKDGSLFWANVVITPVYNGAEALLGFSKVTRDLTERKYAEETLRQAQEQFIQASRMGAMARLAGEIAQEFDALTKAIIRQSKFLVSSLNEGNPLRGRVEEIEKIAESASTLTGQLLAFSSGQVLNPKLLDLNIIVSSIRGTLQWLTGKDIELVTELSPTLGWIKIDPFQMENVVINLAARAREAMELGGKLTIKTSSVKVDTAITHANGIIPSGQYVRLSVGDTGKEMNKEAQTRIFEPFFTTSAKGKETGLRLSTVYGVVRQSGGHIMVKSEVGKGTAFEIYFKELKENDTVRG
jgi:PAS domain S-box-containing protein